jgi:hypothetical protein
MKGFDRSLYQDKLGMEVLRSTKYQVGMKVLNLTQYLDEVGIKAFTNTQC